MKHLSFKYYKCDDILNSFGEEKIHTRYDILYTEIAKFIEVNKLSGNVVTNKGLLGNVIVDYFSDIMRLKNFHIDIEKTNSVKVIAYTAYWFLYRKPIQIVVDISETNKELLTVNERFVLQYVLNYLSEDSEHKKHILLRDNEGLKSFAKLMLYWFVYRSHDAQSIEMVISAFLSGQIYENTAEDISGKLHRYDL